MSETRFTGQDAELRSGYQVAAKLRNYKLVRHSASEYDFEGEIVEANSFWLERGPLDLHVFVGAKPWKWKHVTPTIDGSRVTAVVDGAPER